jgi:hypothetical protein
LPLIQKSSDVIASIVPDQRNVAGEPEIRAQNPNAQVPSPRPGRAASKHPHKAYSARDREQLDTLIQSTGSGN